MGDRAQVVVRRYGSKSDTDGVFLYTHSGGYCLAEAVQAALARKVRWDDPEYLTRIIFCQMVKGAEADECGFGIGLGVHGDIEHPLIVVDPANQRVGFCPRDSMKVGAWFTMDRFVGLSTKELAAAYGQESEDEE